MTQLPSFHDGYMTGVRLGEEVATIYLREVSGSDYELKLTGLEALQVEDFRQGNIIYQLEIVTGRMPELDTRFDRLFLLANHDPGTEYHDREADFLQKQISRIECGEVCLVVITPSYGAGLLAICRKVSCLSV